MSDWQWVGQHMDWGLFAVLVFTGLWWLLGDYFWRVKHVGVQRLLLVLGIGWVVAVAMLVLAWFLLRHS